MTTYPLDGTKEEKRAWAMALPLQECPVDRSVALNVSEPLDEPVHPPRLDVWEGGRLAKIYIPAKSKGGGKRGKAGASRAARKRLLDFVHTIDRDAALPQFVTLTFPDWFPTVGMGKRWLDNLFKRIKRQYPKVAALWRLEVIDRKSGANHGMIAPHFHLLVWGGIDAAWLATAWNEVCGEDGYIAHLKFGTNVKDLDDWASAVNYCAKDMAKPLQADTAGLGRIWGVHNRKALPVVGKSDSVPITPRQAVVLQRAMRKLQRSRSVLSAQRLTIAAAHPCEARPWHTALRAKAAWRRSRNPSRSQTVYSENPMLWLALLCKL